MIHESEAVSCWKKTTQSAQDGCYQILARTTGFWDCIVAGFRAGREYGFAQLDIQPTDRVLIIGMGTGTDFEYLPECTDKQQVKGLDYSSQMVRRAKVKARECGIPEENVLQGDAQRLPFEPNSFDKIFFPLSLGSIPNPALALREAERVLAPNGKISLFEKLVDDGYRVSPARKCVNVVTQCIFADINRSLTTMLTSEEAKLRIVQYDSMQGRLDGCFAGNVDKHYRVALLVRANEHTERPSVAAMVR